MGALRIGITGGIGSGKSTVAALLAARGATLIDTDAIARSLTETGGRAIDAIRVDFGDDAIAGDGSMDRRRMRELAFADVSSRRRLEAILHPLIGVEVERQRAASKAPVDVLDIPLLVESGRWRPRLDRVWVVDCSEETQAARVSARAGWTRDMARAVIAQQASRPIRRSAADAVIDNDNDSISLGELESNVDALWRAALLRSQ